METKIEPVVKWAGGKRQLLNKIQSKLPNDFNNYYEPFVGGGAVLFGLAPLLENKEITINDVNSQLINLYKVIKDDHEEFIEKLKCLDQKHNSSIDKKEFYVEMRDKYNEMIINPDLFSNVDIAVQMVYINKHCFNGLYRVNSKGLFNVPFNNKNNGLSFNKDNIDSVSGFFNKHSKAFEMINGDFEEAVRNASKNDFVFFDSPYAPLKEDTFEAYTKEGFSYDDHVRLADLFKTLSDKGVYCMLTNHNTELINNLYSDFNIEVVPVKRFINSDANNRVGEEAIITNY